MHNNKSHDMYIDTVDLDNVNDNDCICIYPYEKTSKSHVIYMCLTCEMHVAKCD